MKEKNIGYKAMNSDMSCTGGCNGTKFQYEIGKSYEIEGTLKIHESGFHFCKNIFDTLRYYDNIEGNKRFFKIQYNKCINEDDKSVTNKITILEEVNIFNFINDSMNVSDWHRLSMYQKLSESFIREFKDKVNWYHISYFQELSEDFIKEFKDVVFWNDISSAQKLSENFIREFKDKVNWFWISTFQKLSEDFIREFQDKVDWNRISSYQKLSDSFMIEFNDKLNQY